MAVISADADLLGKMRSAVELHQRGLLPQADSIYREILRVRPEHSDALHLSGVIAAQSNDPERAVRMIGRAVEIDPDNAAAHGNLGSALYALRQFRAALASYDRAIELNAEFAEAHFNRANILKELKRLDAAISSYDQAVAARPRFAEASYQRGQALQELGRLHGALASYERTLSIDPSHVAACFGCAYVLHELKFLDAALARYDQAIALKGDFAEAYSNRGNVLYDLKRFDAALQSYDRAISIKPDHADAYVNRGNVFRELGQYDAALSSYHRAIEIKPDFAGAHFNRGVALNELRQVAAGCAAYDRALTIDGGYAEAHFNRSLTRLLTGNYADGWLEHEWRWKNKYGSNIRETRVFSQPLWLGEDSIAGRTILLWSEQGYGDTLQFCRYASLVAERGARVILEVPPPLTRLLAGLSGVSQVIGKGSPLPEFDRHCPLMSLPLAFKTVLDSIPSSGNYLRSDPVKVTQWLTRLGEKTKPRIGLMWSGNEAQPNDHNRSMKLAELLPQLPDRFQYVSLQKSVREADKAVLGASSVLDVADDIADFSDTAALCDCMDLVVSVCTSVAHLSAALGRPTWILLSFAADWRWLLDRTDSPWYSSATLYRQERRGGWDRVVARVRADLVARFKSVPEAAPQLSESS